MAAIPLLVGGIASVYFASEVASNAQRGHDEQVALVCAQEAFYKKFYADLTRDEFDRRIAAKLAAIEAGEVKVSDPDLKELGCSDRSKTIPVLEIFRVQPSGEFSWVASFLPTLAIDLAITLAVSLAVYGIVRAIGWVIGGFTAK